MTRTRQLRNPVTRGPAVPAAVLVSLSLLAAGCTTTPSVGGALVNPLGQGAEVREAPELPTAEAAQACVATARALAAKGYNREAIQEYELARKTNPDLPGVSWQLAVLHEKQGDYDRAEVEYRSALETQPRNADLLCDVGYYHYRRGQPDEAEKHLRQALAQSPAHKTAWGNLALALGAQGRAKESYEAFAHVVRPAQAHANVGILLARAGKEEEARQELRQALELEPNLPQARAVLARLDERPNQEIQPVSAPK